MTNEQNFIQELQELFNKYKVEMEIDGDDRGINFFAYTQRDGNGDVTADQINFSTRFMSWE